jgi:threonylcarbamoyladenosine tRNA methylthiotransferase MtaB
MGCYSQRSPEQVAAIDGVSIVAGTADKMKLAPMIVEMLSSKTDKTEFLDDVAPIIMTKPLDGEKFEPMMVTRPERTRAYVKIEDGCECRCTYCAIADARGPVRSKPVDDVIREVESLYKSGTREIVLTGIETGSYGADFEEKYDLGDLIAELDRRGSCERIRLGSLAPELIGEKFIAKVGKTKILAPHFHLSMQSGSDSVLRGMKRRYNTEMALRNMEIIRAAFPSATFTTDLMVGFPGESDSDFMETVEFVKKARFLDCHVFAYSRREGTPAAAYKNQVPEDVKRKRSEILIAEKNKVRDSVLLEILERGEPLSCIFETVKKNVWTSHSDTFVTVRAESECDLAGRLVLVKPTSVSDGVIYGEIL